MRFSPAPFWKRQAPLVVVAALAGLYGWAILAATAMGHDGVIGPRFNAPGADWVIFLAAARAFFTGDLSHIYDQVWITQAVNSSFAHWLSGPEPFPLFPYPPVFLLLVLPFAALPVGWSLAVSQALSFAGLALAVRRLAPDRFLGGEMTLDLPAARAALETKIATPLALDPVAAADGILRIAATKMSHMVRWVTTERGLDAADFALVAYGGAGPLHAVMIARELRIAKVIIPFAPGHFSAYGMLFADLRRDLVNTWFKPLDAASFDDLEALYRAMEKTGAEDLARSRDMIVEMQVERGADMRYVGQEHAVTVHLPRELFAAHDRAGIKARFDAVHETRYGYSAPGEKAEIVSLRSATIGLMRKPALEPVATGGESAEDAFTGKRTVYFSATGGVDTPTYDRARLKAGNRIEGPALIEEHASTTVVEPKDVLTVDAFGNLHIDIWRN